MPKKLAPVHPGEILTEDFLKPMGLSAYAVATAVGVPRTRIERLARGETPVTADTALRLGKFFDMSAQFWMNAQIRYDFETAEDRNGREIAKMKQFAGRTEPFARSTPMKRNRGTNQDDAPELDSRFFERAVVRNAGKIVKRRPPKGGR